MTLGIVAITPIFIVALEGFIFEKPDAFISESGEIIIQVNDSFCGAEILVTERLSGKQYASYIFRTFPAGKTLSFRANSLEGMPGKFSNPVIRITSTYPCFNPLLQQRVEFIN